MTNMLNANKTGLALGGLVALIHLVWSLLVVFGWAQPLLDWVFQLHMIQPPLLVTPFMLSSAVLLIIVTFIVGYLIGWLFATLWNYLHRA